MPIDTHRQLDELLAGLISRLGEARQDYGARLHRAIDLASEAYDLVAAQNRELGDLEMALEEIVATDERLRAQVQMEGDEDSPPTALDFLSDAELQAHIDRIAGDIGASHHFGDAGPTEQVTPTGQPFSPLGSFGYIPGFTEEPEGGEGDRDSAVIDLLSGLLEVARQHGGSVPAGYFRQNADGSWHYTPIGSPSDSAPARRWPKTREDPLGQGPRDGEPLGAYWQRVHLAEHRAHQATMDRLRREILG